MTANINESDDGTDYHRTVFIAGASGYMRSRLAAELVRRGHSVTGLVRARQGAQPALRTLQQPLLAHTLQLS